MDRIGKAYQRATRNMNKRLLGQPGTYIARQYEGTNTTTGTVNFTESTPIRIHAQPMPISVREMIRFSEAGYRNIETRWSLQKEQVADVKPGDRMTVLGFVYEVLPEPMPMLDEFQVSWIAYTRRVNT